MPQSSFIYDTAADVRLTDIVSKAVAWGRRNLVWLLLGTLVGAGVSLLLNSQSPKQYTSSFIGYGNNLSDLRVRESLMHLNTLRLLNQTDELATRLGLTPAEAKLIVNISGLPNNTLEAELPPFPARENEIYHWQVQCTVTDPQIFPKLERGIVKYVDGLPFVQMVLGEQRAALHRRIAQNDAQVAYLEGIKQNISENMGRISVLDVGTVSRHIVDIAEKTEEMRLKLLKMDHELVVMRPMEIVMKPSSPGPYRAAAYGAALGLVITLVVLGFIGLLRLSKSVA